MPDQSNVQDCVSIIMPAYNSEPYIEEAIQSVLGQTHANWELIIVSDASTDRTEEIVRKYERQDKRICLVSLPANGGVAEARNTGLQKAKGRYVAFLDSDDVWLPHKLEKQLAFMKQKGAAFCFSQYRKFEGSIENHQKVIDVPGHVTYKQLLKGNCIACLTVVIDRFVIGAIHMPKEKHEDYIAWLAILKKGHTAYGMKEDLARYRMSDTSVSANKLKSALWTWSIYRNIEKQPLLPSLYYFAEYVRKGLKKHSSY